MFLLNIIPFYSSFLSFDFKPSKNKQKNPEETRQKPTPQPTK